ncbi:MAG: DUF6198 family protein [Eubacteriales bacterium]
MKRKIKIPALVLYFVGIFFIGFGIPLMITSDLGITVVTSFPYALAVVTGVFTVGMWVTIVQCIILLITILILKRFTISMLASFVTAYLLGLTIDMANLILENLAFASFVAKMINVVIGSCLTGFGAGMLVFSAYPPVPDLVFIRDISKAKSISLNKMKILMDLTFFVLTVTLTLSTLGHVLGIGWGTAVSLAIIGVVVGQTEKLLRKTLARAHLFNEEKEHQFFEYNLLSLLSRKNKKTTE